MSNSSFKKLVIPTLYLISVALVIGSIFIVVNSVNKYLTVPEDYDYVLDKTFSEDTIPVVSTKNSIIRPYLSEQVKIGRYFYDFESASENQEQSIIYYENTYMQNSGVDYVSENVFDIVSILDGEVLNVEVDETLGNIIKIKHNDNLISVYEGIEDITLKEGDSVHQGQILGKSGTSKINKDYASSLHFEVYHNGAVIDPENIYTMQVSDFE